VRQRPRGEKLGILLWLWKEACRDTSIVKEAKAEAVRGSRRDPNPKFFNTDHPIV